MGKCTRLPVAFAKKTTGNGVPLPMPPRNDRTAARYAAVRVIIEKADLVAISYRRDGPILPMTRPMMNITRQMPAPMAR
jgi:hypothetical protein